MKRERNGVRGCKRARVALLACGTVPSGLVCPSGLLFFGCFSFLSGVQKSYKIPRWLWARKLPFIDFGVLADEILRR
jgi:hypothetical protein